MIVTMWLTVGLLITIAAFQRKQGFMNILIVLGCIMAALGQLYWVFEFRV